MIAVDLFCGAGGLTRGLLNAGVEVVLGIDVNEDYRKTYEDNNAPAKFIRFDICDVHAKDVLKYLPSSRHEYDLALVGCAPCQPFSSHRRFQPSRNENRLLMEFGRLVGELKPEWVFMENVPGLIRVRGFSAYRRFSKTLSELDYSFDSQIVDAKRFGVPQTRRRFVMLASRTTTAKLPEPTHGPDALPFRTVQNAIGDLPAIRAGETCPEIPNHRAAEITPINLRRLKRTPHDGGSRSSWPDDLALECHKDSSGHEDVYGRMKWNAPAPTLTCRCFSISNGRYGHPEQHRAISLREAANLQSFPKHYVFYGKSQRSIGEQIGNAVPVALAEAIGRQLIELAAAQSTANRHRNKRISKRKRANA